MKQTFSNRIAYIITCLALVFSGGAVVLAQSYNWIPLGSIGATWASNGAHIYSVNPGSVVVGGNLPDSGLLLDVAGAIGGTQFCDASGNNCFSATDIQWEAISGSSSHQYSTNAGNVGIGVAAPTQKLHVDGNVLATSFLYTSDERLKDNIRPLEGMALVGQLEGVRFDWARSGESTVGLVAQEVEKVLPELVFTDEESGMKSVQYANLIAVLIEALKEQDKRIEQLEAMVQTRQ